MYVFKISKNGCQWAKFYHLKPRGVPKKWPISETSSITRNTNQGRKYLSNFSPLPVKLADHIEIALNIFWERYIDGDASLKMF